MSSGALSTTSFSGRPMAVAALLLTLLAVPGALATSSPPPQTNLRPVIGIVSQPLHSSSSDADGLSYIAASYVKWVE